MNVSEEILGSILHFLSPGNLTKAIKESFYLCSVALRYYPWDLKTKKLYRHFGVDNSDVVQYNTHVKKEDMFLLMVDSGKLNRAKHILLNNEISTSVMNIALIELVREYTRSITELIEFREKTGLGLDDYGLIDDWDSLVEGLHVYIETARLFLSHGSDPSYKQSWVLYCVLGYPKMLQILLEDPRSNPNVYNDKIAQMSYIPVEVEHGHLLADFTNEYYSRYSSYMNIEKTWEILLDYPKKFGKDYYDPDVYLYLIVSPGCPVSKMIESLPDNYKYGSMLGKALCYTGKLDYQTYHLILNNKKTKLENFRNRIIFNISLTDGKYALGKLKMILKDKRFKKHILDIFISEFAKLRIKRIKMVLNNTPYTILGSFLVYGTKKKKVFDLFETAILKAGKYYGENSVLGCVKWLLSRKWMSITHFNRTKYMLMASKMGYNRVLACLSPYNK